MASRGEEKAGKMKIYNTLTRKKEEFKPIKKGRVGMYVCGPTVYDEPHIGHARSAYIFDVVKRYLEYRKLKVTFVRNVTDVDDKIIAKAREEFKNEDLNSATKKISTKYLKIYHEAMADLGIGSPDKEPKATEYIEKMKIFIKDLVDREVAYASGGDVYFDIKKAKNYGKLSNQSLDNMEIGARISPGDNKKDPLDFALWKAAKEDEPSWPSSWGRGRPGWHIECSVMSSDILGDEFDIHAGGIDLIFPHHENEIAQSEGAGKKFANCWIHNGLLTINGEKMAKSLGNFVTIKDFISKHKNPDYLKLIFLTAHYRSPLDYSNEKIEEVKRAYERIDILMRKLNEISWQDKKPSGGAGDIGHFRDKFIEYMDDDFNTPKALSVLFDMINRCNKLLDSDDEFKNFKLRYAMDIIREITDVFGLKPGVASGKEDIDKEIKNLIKKRNDARKDKKFDVADELRKTLEQKGIILEDTAEGTTWRRKIT